MSGCKGLHCPGCGHAGDIIGDGGKSGGTGITAGAVGVIVVLVLIATHGRAIAHLIGLAITGVTEIVIAGCAVLGIAAISAGTAAVLITRRRLRDPAGLAGTSAAAQPRRLTATTTAAGITSLTRHAPLGIPVSRSRPAGIPAGQPGGRPAIIGDHPARQIPAPARRAISPAPDRETTRRRP